MEVSSGSDFGSSMKGKGPSVSEVLRTSAGTGSFSCFHGEAKRPPVDDATLRDCFEIKTKYIDKFYREAARRLPLKEIPELEACMHAGGLCFGLADPVSNIILNTVGLLHHLHDREEGPPLPTRGFADIAMRSLFGLRGFMTVYFRYLGDTDGSRYLYLASHDLRLAISLVHHDRYRYAFDTPFHNRTLLPDGGNLRAALRVAALDANHPFPDVLARFMTAQYPSALLSSVLGKLQAAEQLATDDISEIRDLLGRQWPPSTPPVNLEFWCRPNGDNCSLADDGTLLISTCIGAGRVATISIANADQPPRDHQLGHISDVTFQDMDIMIYDCLHQSMVGTVETDTLDYDASPCTHTFVLEMCLLDTIHACYIRALATLPRIPLFLRALIVGGHCYGPFQPFLNIILNTIWYDLAFPLPPGAEFDLPEGILDTRSLSRLESRSLDGLVQMVCVTFNKSKHKALEYLNSLDCDLSTTQSEPSGLRIYSCYSGPFDFAAKAAKHPQHAANASFLMSAATSGCCDYLYGMLISFSKNARAHELHDIYEFVLRIMPVPPQEKNLCSLSPFGLMKISRTMSNYKNKLDFVSIELRKLLHKYCYQHPWEPAYHLEFVCGVRGSKSHNNQTNFYHANFLAITELDTSVRTLFFAEFWVSPSPEDVQSKPSICYPIYDYSYACTGRCSFCEGEGIKIMHPPSGGYSGVIDRLNPVQLSYRVGFKSVLETDLIYLETGSDAEVAKGINDFPDFVCNDIPLMTCTPRVWERNGDIKPFGPAPVIPEDEITFVSAPRINLAFSRLNN